MKKSIFSILTLGALMMTGCHNSDVEYPDFDYQTLYFSKATPVRTITLGEEIFADNTIDNEHAFEIKACLGGVNTNKKDRWVKFVIDESLCDRITFADGRPVKAMPASYYTYTTDRMVIKKGEVLGGVRIELTDAYFADPASAELNYVIPVVMVEGSERIISGVAKDGVENPDRLNKDHWSTVPMDYTLYAVKYKNPYHGCWLSKGVDKIDNNGAASTVDRQADLWENASLRYLTTKSLTRSAYTFTHIVPFIDAEGAEAEKTLTCEMLIDIDNNGTCTISTQSAGCTATGNGKWTRLGEPKAWGDRDRDKLELSYTYVIDYVINEQTGQHATYKVSCDEVLCMRDRQNRLEEFSYILK